MTRKNSWSSFSRQSSETKPNPNWSWNYFKVRNSCFVSNLTKPIKKIFMRLIYLKNSTFLSLKIIVDTDWCQEWNIKTPLLKINWNKHITLLSDANVLVRFRARQRAKCSSLQLTVNCIAAKRCLRHYFKLIWESPTTEDTNFHHH